MRIAWLTNIPQLCVGYATISRNLLPIINKNHPSCLIANFGLQTSQKLENFWNGITFYGVGETGMDESLIPAHIKDFKSDIFISIYDVWALNQLPTLLRQNNIVWIPWVPVDSDRLNPRYREKLQTAYKIIPMSKHSEKCLKKYFPDKTLPCIYPGIDLDVYKPLWETAEEKNKIKKTLNFSEDTFLITLLGDTRGQRNRWAETLQGISLFRKRNPNIKFGVYIHGNLRISVAPNFDIQQLIIEEDLGGFVRVVDPYNYSKGIADRDIAKIYNASDVYVQCSQGHGAGLCCHPETFIETENGLKKIENIKVGDMVLTHKGRFKKVLNVSKRQVEENLIVIESYGLSQKLKVTEDHPILCVPRQKKLGHNGNRNWLADPQWILSKRMKKGDCILFPKLQINKSFEYFDLINFDKKIKFDDNYVWYKQGYSSEIKSDSYRLIRAKLNETEKVVRLGVYAYHNNIIPTSQRIKKVYDYLGNINYKKVLPNKLNRKIILDSELAYVLGWYAAEGSTTNKYKSIEFSLHKKEINYALEIKDIIEKKFGYRGGHIRIHNFNLRLTFSNKVIAKFFSSLCGMGAINKKMPKEILYGQEKELMEFIRGVSLGDGHIKKNSVVVTVISKSLVNNIFLGLLKLGLKARTRGPFESVGNIKSKNLLYSVYYNLDNKNFVHGNKSWICNKYLRLLVKNVSKEFYKGKVFNLQVEEDETYITQGGCVHNCYLEAAACGTPSIGTNCTSIPEVLNEPKTGYLVDPIFEEYDPSIAKKSIPNPEQLAEKLEMIYKKGSVNFRDDCVKFAKQFSWEKIYNEKWLPTLAMLEKEIQKESNQPLEYSDALKQKARKIIEDWK